MIAPAQSIVLAWKVVLLRRAVHKKVCIPYTSLWHIFFMILSFKYVLEMRKDAMR